MCEATEYEDLRERHISTAKELAVVEEQSKSNGAEIKMLRKEMKKLRKDSLKMMSKLQKDNLKMFGEIQRQQMTDRSDSSKHNEQIASNTAKLDTLGRQIYGSYGVGALGLSGHVVTVSQLIGGG